MGRRPDGSRFMPGVYVFPGGAVESADCRVPTRGALPEPDASLVVAGDVEDIATLAVTAIRETFEETCMLCPGGLDGRNIDWSQLLESEWRPDLRALRYLGRALTPPGLSRRFHARFFYTLVEAHDLPVSATAELEDLRWVHPQATGDLPIAPVTRFMLGELGRRLDSAAAPERTPFYYWRGSVEQVDYDLPGQG